MKIRIAIGAGALTLLTVCSPPPPTNTSPVISAFSVVTPSGSTPITTALTWTISDTDNDSLTCRIDLENDGTYDKTVAACTSASLRTATFTSVGVTTVKLQVTDGTSTPNRNHRRHVDRSKPRHVPNHRSSRFGCPARSCRDLPSSHGSLGSGHQDRTRR